MLNVSYSSCLLICFFSVSLYPNQRRYPLMYFDQVKKTMRTQVEEDAAESAHAKLCERLMVRYRCASEIIVTFYALLFSYLHLSCVVYAVFPLRTIY